MQIPIRTKTEWTGLKRAAATLLLTIPIAYWTNVQSSAAAIYQCGSIGSYWAGWTSQDHDGPQPASEIEGSSAYIYTNYAGQTCGTDHRQNSNFIVSYDMVYDQHGAHYSQAGTFFGYGGPCVEKFTEQKKSGFRS